MHSENDHDRPRSRHRSLLHSVHNCGSNDAGPSDLNAGHHPHDREHHHGDDRGCCSAGPSTLDDEPEISERANGSGNDTDDTEKSAGREHVLLAATGLDCSGCGKQLTQVLNSISGIANVRVNFVVGQADFDIVDPRLQVVDIIRRVERATTFKCIRIGSEDTFIDVLMDKDSIPVALRNAPNGITEITALNKKTARVTYDPLVIGARTIVRESVGGLAQFIKGLAPLDLSDPVATAGKKRMYQSLLKTIFAAVFTVPVCVFAWAKLPAGMRTRGILSLTLATPVQVLAVHEFYIPAVSALVYSRRVELDMLVVLSISAAYLYSAVAVVFTIMREPLETEEFFETSTLLITLVLLGRLISAYARLKAISSVSTRTLQPCTATVIENGELVEIDVRLMQYDDIFSIPAHSKVPTDGEVFDGVSEVDESLITGESLPVRKSRGMPVIAGTINGDCILAARLTRLPGRNTVTDIAGLVEEASNQKPKVQDLADRVAGWFVPVVLGISVAVLIIWLGICFNIRQQSAGAAIGTSMTYAIAVLAVSCPCALGLAVPMVLVMAGGVATRGGVVIKSAESTERARQVTDVVFDKTGTITSSDLYVVLEDLPVAGTNLYMMREAFGIAKALVRDSKHPVSMAVAKHLQSNVADERLGNIRSIPGSGIEATLEKSTVRAGNAHWLGVQHLQLVARVIESGMTTLCVTRDDELLAVFGLKSNIRPEAAEIIKELNKRDIDVHLVSGDEEMAVNEVAYKVGIPNAYVASRKTPVQKRDYVRELMETDVDFTGKKKVNRMVLFCGDGTNDAIAIAQSDIGVQFGSSSDLTRATADVVLLSASLDALMHLLDISRAAYWRIVLNFVWAAVYNVCAILLAAGAFVKIRIPPAYAGLGELVSVLPVVIIAASLGIRSRRRTSNRNKKNSAVPEC